MHLGAASGKCSSSGGLARARRGQLRWLLSFESNCKSDRWHSMVLDWSLFYLSDADLHPIKLRSKPRDVAASESSGSSGWWPAHARWPTAALASRWQLQQPARRDERRLLLFRGDEVPVLQQHQGNLRRRSRPFCFEPTPNCINSIWRPPTARSTARCSTNSNLMASSLYGELSATLAHREVEPELEDEQGISLPKPTPPIGIGLVGKEHILSLSQTHLISHSLNSSKG